MNPLRFAYIEVPTVDGSGGVAWPLVERVPGGWQSGEHHYPDADVIRITQEFEVDPS